MWPKYLSPSKFIGKNPARRRLHDERVPANGAALIADIAERPEVAALARDPPSASRASLENAISCEK
jgi:hypothetical protein